MFCNIGLPARKDLSSNEKMIRMGSNECNVHCRSGKAVPRDNDGYGRAERMSPVIMMSRDGFKDVPRDNDVHQWLLWIVYRTEMAGTASATAGAILAF